MNKIILGVFLFISFLGSAQKSEYIYVIKFLKCCDEPTHHDPNWKLKSSNDDIYLPDNNQVIVPDSGQYFLISSIYDNQPVPILIKNINQTDTIYLTCLYIENSEIVTNKRYNQSAPIYTTCSGKINSIYTEFFPDNQLRIKGNFSQGIIIDSLVEYYYSGTVKSKVKKNKTIYENWEYYPNGKVKKIFQYDLKKRSLYQFFEYDEFGKIVTEIDYSKKYSYRHFDTGTIKTTTPRRRYEQYFIVNDSIRYQCKKEIETTFYSNGNKKLEFSNKPLFWIDQFKHSKNNILKEYRLQVFHEDSANIKIQEVIFLTRNEVTIYNGGLAKLEIADASSISFYNYDKRWIIIYPIVYEGENNKEIVLYELYDYFNDQFNFKKLKPHEIEKYLKDRMLEIKSW